MENIDKIKVDSRTIGAKGQYAKRLDIIRLYFEEHYSGPQIAELLSISKTYIYNIINLYKEGGLEAIKIRKRGRAKGAKRSISQDQEDKIKNIIFNQKPQDFGLIEALWNKKNIRSMIKSNFNVDIPRSTMGDYLARWGFSSQRPVKRAYKQEPQMDQFYIS